LKTGCAASAAAQAIIARHSFMDQFCTKATAECHFLWVGLEKPWPIDKSALAVARQRPDTIQPQDPILPHETTTLVF
jgi:hypothetical protein